MQPIIAALHGLHPRTLCDKGSNGYALDGDNSDPEYTVYLETDASADVEVLIAGAAAEQGLDQLPPGQVPITPGLGYFEVTSSDYQRKGLGATILRAGSVQLWCTAPDGSQKQGETVSPPPGRMIVELEMSYPPQH